MKAEITVDGTIRLIPESETETYAIGQRMQDKKPLKISLQLSYRVEVKDKLEPKCEAK